VNSVNGQNALGVPLRYTESSPASDYYSALNNADEGLYEVAFDVDSDKCVDGLLAASFVAVDLETKKSAWEKAIKQPLCEGETSSNAQKYSNKVHYVKCGALNRFTFDQDACAVGSVREKSFTARQNLQVTFSPNPLPSSRGPSSRSSRTLRSARISSSLEAGLAARKKINIGDNGDIEYFSYNGRCDIPIVVAPLKEGQEQFYEKYNNWVQGADTLRWKKSLNQVKKTSLRLIFPRN